MESKVVKFAKAPRYKSPNFREVHRGNVSVDADGRVFLFGNEASPLVVDSRFHFFEKELTADEWVRVRAFYQLPKTKRRSLISNGVRRGEGKLVGLYPKRPIKDIQDERGKEAGEKSFRLPAYGKAFERLVAKDIAKSAQKPMIEDKAVAAFDRGADEVDDLLF